MRCRTSPRSREKLGELLMPRSRREAVTWVTTEKGYAQRRAYALLGIAPKTFPTLRDGMTIPT